MLRAWHTVPSYYSYVEIMAFQVMPEHVHGLLYLKPGNTTHLGRIVQGFMIACTHNYWDVLGLDWRSKTSTPGRNNEYNDRDHTRSSRGPSLFVRGYNDVEALTPEQVATKIEYIRSNPERRLMKSQHRTSFVIHRDQKTPTWSVEAIQRALSNDPFLSRHPLDRSAAYLRVQPRLHTAPLPPAPEEGRAEAPIPASAAPIPAASIPASAAPAPAASASAPHLLLDYVGSRALLAAPRKVCLVCHRADAALFDAQSAAVLAAARAGAVVVSAFISPRERTIRQQLLDEGLSLVEVMDNGFSDRYKPSAHALAACAAGRLLQITPWTYTYDRDVTLRREMCLVMNELARLIAGTPDDWWKAPQRP